MARGPMQLHRLKAGPAQTAVQIKIITAEKLLLVSALRLLVEDLFGMEVLSLYCI